MFTTRKRFQAACSTYDVLYFFLRARRLFEIKQNTFICTINKTNSNWTPIVWLNIIIYICTRQKVEKQSTSLFSCRGRAKDECTCGRPWTFKETKCVLFSGWFFFIFFFNNIVTRRFSLSPSRTPCDAHYTHLQPVAVT